MPGHIISESHPWQSNSCGVSPKQAEQFTEELRKRGCMTGHFDPQTGKAIATTNSARNTILEMQGQVDLDGGYRQYTGR